jgi:hypothetical protein
MTLLKNNIYFTETYNNNQQDTKDEFEKWKEYPRATCCYE